jgi:hypothetical protein
MINNVLGNILYAQENLICQQVNHQKVMGAGLAKQIRNKYPDIYIGYCNFCDDHTFEEIKSNGMFYVYDIPETDKHIICIFGQDDYGTDKVYTDYKALENSFMNLKSKCFVNDDTIAIPYMMGCGLAGGNWWYGVYPIIENLFSHSAIRVTIYEYGKF